MKKTVGIIFLLIFIPLYGLTAFGVDIDGNNRGDEWDGATAYLLVNGESNSSVEFGSVKVKMIPEEYAVYFCFNFIDSGLEVGNTEAGISLSVEGSPYYVLTASNSPSEEDVDKYEVSGAMYIDENNGGTCEVRVGIKNGVPKELDCAVRFIDYQGVPSNVYYFTLINEQYEEITQQIIRPTADNSDPVYNPDLLTTKQAKTTKAKKTTTEKTTAETTTKTTTSKAKTTTATTKKTTTKQSTEKTATGATVYYYEKEVIISQVIVTEPATESETVTEAVTTAEETRTNPHSEKIPLSTGSKYKAVAGIGGAVAFILLAAWGAAGVKKSSAVNNDEENTDNN